MGGANGWMPTVSVPSWAHLKLLGSRAMAAGFLSARTRAVCWGLKSKASAAPAAIAPGLDRVSALRARASSRGAWRREIMGQGVLGSEKSDGPGVVARCGARSAVIAGGRSQKQGQQAALGEAQCQGW